MTTGALACFFRKEKMKILYLCITNAFYDKGKFCNKRKTTYECTRKYWNLRNLQKASEAEYIVGVAKGKIEGIYKKTEDWKLVQDMPELLNDDEVKENPKYLKRYAFTGEEISRDSKEGKAIISEYEKNPFRFYGNVGHYNY